MTYNEKLHASVIDAQSTLCVGLDPNLSLLPKDVKQGDGSPADRVELFLKRVIDVTIDHCSAYKPNLGFFEALGPSGWDCFQEILDYIPDNKVIVADAKRGDISSTAEHYAKAFFEYFDVDAVTLNPLMGFETLDPFIKDPSKGIYVLALTSNPGAEDLLLRKISGGQTIATYLAERLSVVQDNTDTAVGMVVGATKAADLQPVISKLPESPLLIPGIGAQGGSIAKLAKAIASHKGIPLVNSSRSIIYAGNDKENWEQAVAKSASEMKESLRSITEKYVRST